MSKLFKDGNIAELQEELERSVDYYGMQSMNQSLAALVINGVVTRAKALENSPNPADLDLMLRKFFFANADDSPGQEASMQSVADYSRIHKLLEIEQLHQEAQERHQTELEERNDRIRQLEQELSVRADDVSGHDERVAQVEEERDQLTRALETQRAEFEAKIERLQARIRELAADAGPVPPARGGSFFRR